jgi:hypothetical protein
MLCPLYLGLQFSDLANEPSIPPPDLSSLYPNGQALTPSKHHFPGKRGSPKRPHESTHTNYYYCLWRSANRHPRLLSALPHWPGHHSPPSSWYEAQNGARRGSSYPARLLSSLCVEQHNRLLYYLALTRVAVWQTIAWRLRVFLPSHAPTSTGGSLSHVIPWLANQRLSISSFALARGNDM